MKPPLQLPWDALSEELDDLRSRNWTDWANQWVHYDTLSDVVAILEGGLIQAMKRIAELEKTVLALQRELGKVT